jgi:hypothetical protein
MVRELTAPAAFFEIFVDTGKRPAITSRKATAALRYERLRSGQECGRSNHSGATAE